MLDFLIWLDVKILWACTFGRSRPGETISAAAWSLKLDSKWQGRVFVPVIDWLFQKREADHCLKAYTWQKHLYTGGLPSVDPRGINSEMSTNSTTRFEK